MDDTDARVLWDRKFERGLPSLTKADPFFVSAYERSVDHLFPNTGRALDLAAGLGRHALWLAGKAWSVTAVDVSTVAIGKLGQAAGQLQVAVNLFAMDAAAYTFEAASFDLVVLFYHFDRRLFPRIVHALSPGGVFICKMAVHWAPEGGSRESKAEILGRSEIVSLVPDLEVMHYRERPVRDRGVLEFVGRKPGFAGRH
jgi:SAM-dependent methyltransferase